MSKLSKDEVLKLARLARLTLQDDEIEQYQAELGTIIDYFELLDNADVEGLVPTSQVTGLTNVYRNDVVEEQPATPDELLAIVPLTQDRYIKVKRMI